jgi:hypothetical protein
VSVKVYCYGMNNSTIKYEIINRLSEYFKSFSCLHAGISELGYNCLEFLLCPYFMFLIDWNFWNALYIMCCVFQLRTELLEHSCCVCFCCVWNFWDTLCII